MRLPAPRVTLAAAAAAVLVSTSVAAIATTGARVGAAEVPPTTQPIASVDLVCPVAASVKGVAQATLAAAAAPATPGTAGGDGTISVYPLSATPTAAPLATAAAGSSVLRYVVPAGKGGALVVRATGRYAQGLTAAVTTRVPGGIGRALHAEQCTASGSTSWFVGGGASLGDRAVLFLTNIEAAPATVDVTIFSADGVQRPVPVQGRTIAPGALYSVGIDTLVPGKAATAVLVRTRSGRVTAALLDTQANGLRPLGADWVPPTAAPAKSVVLTGIPADDGAQRTLQLLVPGAFDATVNVHLLTTDGTLSPDPLQGLSVQSGQLFTLDLAQAPTTGPFSVVVESDQPLSAGLRTVLPVTAAGKFPDFSYAAGVAPVAHAVVLPAAQHTATINTFLQLTAPGADDVVVELTPLVTSGIAPTPQRITVTAGTTMQVPVGPLGAALSAVLVETAPRAGPVYVGWVTSEAGVHGPLVTGGPLPQTPAALLLPRVAPDPAVGYPAH